MLPKHSNESAIRFFAKLNYRKGSVRARKRRGVTPPLQIWTRIRARLSGHSIHSPFSLAPLLSKPLTLTRHDVEYQREERESDKEEAHACSFLLECLLLAERKRKKKLSLRGLKKRKERRSKAFCEARRKNQLEKKIFFLSHHSTKAKRLLLLRRASEIGSLFTKAIPRGEISLLIRQRFNGIRSCSKKKRRKRKTKG